MAEITADSPTVQIKSQYPDLTIAKIEECKRNFKKFDQDGDGMLNLTEVTFLLESIGQTKTHLEVKQLIAEVDSTGKGAINFKDFMRACFPREGEPLPLFGRIYQSALAGHAKFFEEKIRESKGLSKEQLEEKVKREAALRKEERELKKKEQEKAASKARFAERLAVFKQAEEPK